LNVTRTTTRSCQTRKCAVPVYSPGVTATQHVLSAAAAAAADAISLLLLLLL